MGGGDCFIKGTRIETIEGPIKIEDVQIGQRVLTMSADHKIQAQEVHGLMTQYHTGEGNDYMVRIMFDNGVENVNTNTHPYFIKDIGWASWVPEETYRRYDLKVAQLQVGDIAFYFDGEGVKETQIISIEEDRNPVITYNLSKVAVNHNFFANGILVHNKGGGGGASGSGFGGATGPGSSGAGGIGAGSGSAGGSASGGQGGNASGAGPGVGSPTGEAGMSGGFGAGTPAGDSGFGGATGGLGEGNASGADTSGFGASFGANALGNDPSAFGASVASDVSGMSGGMSAGSSTGVSFGEDPTGLGLAVDVSSANQSDVSVAEAQAAVNAAENAAAISSISSTMSSISKGLGILGAVTGNPALGALGMGLGVLGTAGNAIGALGDMGTSGAGEGGVGIGGVNGPDGTGPTGGGPGDFPVNTPTFTPNENTGSNNPAGEDTGNVFDTGGTSEDIQTNTVDEYLKELQRRRDERFGYFETRQFQPGENPFIFIPTAWGEGGAGSLDVANNEDITYIFG